MERPLSAYAPGGYFIESEALDGAGMRYAVTLTNRTDCPIEGFRLALSGPGRIHPETSVENGRLVRHLGSYAEFAPPAASVLEPGASWRFCVDRPDSRFRHWTDGITAGFLILADGTTASASCETPRRPRSGPGRRGTVRLGGATTAPVSILPWPADVAVSGRRTPPDGFWLAQPATDGAAAAWQAFAELCDLLFPGWGIARTRDQGGLMVRLEADHRLGRGAYRIAFSPDQVRIEAGGHAGHVYGLVTLGQILRGAQRAGTAFCFPERGTIADAPAMGFRGCHLDVARQFYGVLTLRRLLAILAWNKLNIFHWHLSDDEAWRVELEACPRLTEIGAWRGHGLPLPPLLGSGPERTGGFYSRYDVRDLVALADRFAIEVVPEIDMPGHCFALLQSLPALRDPGEAGTYLSSQLFPNNCLNPALPETCDTLEAIVGELAGLFPGRYFHLGADEVAPDAWASSSAAAALRRRLGVSGSGPLQAAFLQRMQAFLVAGGKVAGAWEEGARGGGITPRNSYLVGWSGPEAARKLAAAGYNVVAAPQDACYLDMALGPQWEEPGASWAPPSSPRQTYGFDPVAGWSETEKARLLGIQACIWSESMGDPAVFDRLVFPRLSAIAETAWSHPAAKSYDRFAALADLMPNLYGCYEAS